MKKAKVETDKVKLKGNRKDNEEKKRAYKMKKDEQK